MVVDSDGRFANIVSQADLFSLPSARATELVEAIAQAQDITQLAIIAAEVRGFCRQMLTEDCPPMRSASRFPHSMI